MLHNWEPIGRSLNRSTNLNLCVITFPLHNYVPLAILIQLLEPLADKIMVITGNFPQDAITNTKVSIINVKHNHKKQSILARIPKYIITQLKISYHLMNRGRKCDTVLFFIGGTGLLFPALVAKLLKKKTIQIITGASLESAKELYKGDFWGFGGFIFLHIFSVLERLTFSLSNRIVVYSPRLIPQLGLDRYRNKVVANIIWPTDANLFRPVKDLAERENLVGYFGRLSPEKGVMNLVRAIPLILAEREDVKFFLGGNGPLLYEIETELENSQCQGKVTLAGWVPHEKMPYYLNQIKLLILPSYTEGLPNILLEAMACGAPVVAMPIGSIPDLISNGETGFLLEDNSPEAIAKGVLEALRHPYLSDIAKSARCFIEQNYTFRAATERYKTILNSM